MAQKVLVGIVHEPITKGLRDQITVEPGAELCDGRDPDGNYVFTSAVARCELKGFTEACDAIDAIHAALERENEKLRKEQKEWSIGATEAMAFVDRLTDAAEKREEVTILGVDYTALPLDADGEPIHVGDEMDTSSFGTVEVEGFVHSAIAFYNYEDQQARLCTSPAKLCHHHKPVVADLLREFAESIGEHSAMYTSGAINADERQEADERAIEHYAKRLQLAEVDE